MSLELITDGMTSRLEVIFGELGISQYLHAFIDQGFDTWDTILDITESDLDALGVKLGHRRKLQRRIANFRGVAPDAALISPTRQSIEDPRSDGPKSETSKADGPTVAVVKRKYRRHPKPDEDAPERPPSAYVLFSNKMREDLKDRNLTFTEIAKLVGDNWQNLTPAEKEPYESQAQRAKDKYTRELSEYKKTPAYSKYMAYLADFKAKHSGHTQDKDASKRVKMTGSGGGSPSSGGTPQRGRSSTHSGGEDEPGKEPARDRRHRGSSAAEVQRGFVDANMPDARLKDHPMTAQQAWSDGQGGNARRALPRFSDMFDDGSSSTNATARSTEKDGYTIPMPAFRHTNSVSTASTTPGSVMTTPGLVGGQFKPPSLTKQYSSTDSAYSNPRTPLDNPLPIHALLSGKPGQPEQPGQQIYELPHPSSTASFSHGAPAKMNPASPSYPFPTERIGPMPAPDGFFHRDQSASTHNRHEESRVMSPQHSMTGLTSPRQSTHQHGPPGTNTNNSKQGDLDGISALLQARDIVDQRGH